MIERIARRAGGFASTTALRWIGAAGERIPDAVTPETPGSGKVRKRAVTGAAAGAVALLTSSKTVRAGVERGLHAASQTLRTETSGNGSSPSGNGIGDLAEKTRDELYELARKANVRGRSTMSKDALVKALTK